MSNPQQPELRRSENLARLTPDAIAGDLAARSRPSTDGNHGPVPADNRPGHQSGPVQDKPDLDAFAKRLGTDHGRRDDQAGQPGNLDASSPWYQAKQVVIGAAALAVGGAVYGVARARRAMH